MPAIYVNCFRTIHWHKTGRLESFPRISQIWTGEEKTSLSPLMEAVRCETVNVSLSYGESSEKIRSFSVFKRCRRETWRVQGRFKFQVTGVPRPSWSLHSLPSLWHERYPSILPGEFSYVYTSPDCISVTCTQDSCLLNIRIFFTSSFFFSELPLHVVCLLLCWKFSSFWLILWEYHIHWGYFPSLPLTFNFCCDLFSQTTLLFCTVTYIHLFSYDCTPKL